MQSNETCYELYFDAWPFHISRHGSLVSTTTLFGAFSSHCFPLQIVYLTHFNCLVCWLLNGMHNVWLGLSATPSKNHDVTVAGFMCKNRFFKWFYNEITSIVKRMPKNCYCNHRSGIIKWAFVCASAAVLSQSTFKPIKFGFPIAHEDAAQFKWSRQFHVLEYRDILINGVMRCRSS